MNCPRRQFNHIRKNSHNHLFGTFFMGKSLKQCIPEIHHSDQGVQYAANAYVQILEENEIAISMAGVGKAYENSFAERLMRTMLTRHCVLGAAAPQ